MNQSSALRRQLILWGLLLGLWALLVLAFAGQLAFTGGLSLGQAMWTSLRDWLPWAALSPLAAWLALRFPLERQKLLSSIPVHVAACVLALFFYEAVAPRAPGPPGGLPGGPGFRQREGLPPGPGPERRPFNPGPDGPWFGPGPGPGQPEGDFPPGAPRGPRRAPLRSSFLNRLIIHSRFNIPIYWAIVSIVHALTYYSRSQEGERKGLELEHRLTDAKLQALRMQLHPHFLFNTLNAISTLVHKDPHAADEMIGNLSELLRAALDTTDQEIPLREELRLLDRYLEIQQARFGERLRIEREIDLAALDGQVPTLILQPLVENAIRHGIEPQPGPGVVGIRAQRKGERLELAVRDSGAGPKPPAKAPEGIGLANTKARLQELYGQSARLVLNGGAQGGCSVEIELPFRERIAASAPVPA